MRTLDCRGGLSPGPDGAFVSIYPVRYIVICALLIGRNSDCRTRILITVSITACFRWFSFIFMPFGLERERERKRDRDRRTKIKNVIHYYTLYTTIYPIARILTIYTYYISHKHWLLFFLFFFSIYNRRSKDVYRRLASPLQL